MDVSVFAPRCGGQVRRRPRRLAGCVLGVLLLTLACDEPKKSGPTARGPQGTRTLALPRAECVVIRGPLEVSIEPGTGGSLELEGPKNYIDAVRVTEESREYFGQKVKCVGITLALGIHQPRPKARLSVEKLIGVEALRVTAVQVGSFGGESLHVEAQEGSEVKVARAGYARAQINANRVGRVTAPSLDAEVAHVRAVAGSVVELGQLGELRVTRDRSFVKYQRADRVIE